MGQGSRRGHQQYGDSNQLLGFNNVRLYIGLIQEHHDLIGGSWLVGLHYRLGGLESAQCVYCLPCLTPPGLSTSCPNRRSSCQAFCLLQRQRQLARYRQGWHAARPGFLAQQFHKLRERHLATPRPRYRHPFHLLSVMLDY
jgi:hypothetical protein